MKKLFALVVLVITATLALATSAAAVIAVIGNPATDRTNVDTWQNFVIVDTNHSAPFDGYFTGISYFAEQPGVVRFIVVDANDEVTWISDEVDAAAGAGQLTLAQPVGLTAGSNLGVYSRGFGVISFDYAEASPAPFTNYGSGLPAVGETLDYVFESERIYSMNADVHASSPAICKNDGWMSYGYTNQGQCIASIVANENSGK